ncbi:MAG TPA: S8 family serine peptidase [Gemmatimonadaceae bacterium]|nr:S8 family serine peptidase [Gemmatimonadaceae bacterium]
MTKSRLFGALLVFVAACATPQQQPPAPAPAPASVAATPADTATTPTVARDSAAHATPPASPTPAAPPQAVDEDVPRTAPAQWHLMDETADRVAGMSVLRARNELLAGRQPKRTVIVAVIDGGVDSAHVDLRSVLWTNTREVPGNRVDDDHDGYVDDVHGWNFIGGADGRDVDQDTFEVTREYARCTRDSTAAGSGAPRNGGTPSAAHSAAADTGNGDLLRTGRGSCAAVEQEFTQQVTSTTQTLSQITTAQSLFERATDVLRAALHVDSAAGDSLDMERVRAYQPRTAEEQQARAVYLQLAARGITADIIRNARQETETRLHYGLNPDFNPRTIVGDQYANLAQRHYGNPDFTGPDAGHGTHVAGIIGAVQDSTNDVGGIATAVRIMPVRAVPDGDERDKDIANAIRFAVDHGANVINMSFGKGYSPQKQAVDDAVRYADAHGVLMVHAAGNDGADLAQKGNFPTPRYVTGGRAANWIEVGASSWRGLDSLAAPFSNYGAQEVDVFAPGEDILSTVPGGYERNSGTSMAAPMVSGLAALIMSYYPSLSASDVKRIILASATRYADHLVVRPGSDEGERVPFGSLSVTGGIVNAYAALRMAEAESGSPRGTPQPTP